MNCTRCGNTSDMQAKSSTTRIKHVQGNAFRWGVPLEKRVVEWADGVRSVTDFSLSPLLDGAPVKAVLGKGPIRHEYDAAVEDGYVVFEDKGTLPVGTWNLTILATDVNGDPLRYKDNFVLQIVDTTAEADYNALEQYDGYFKFPILKFGGGKYGNMWDRALVWVSESPWARN